MDDLNPRAVLGANNPPPYDPDKLADLAARTDDFMAASTKIRQEHNPIQSEEAAKLLTDHVAGLRGLKKQVDDGRIDAKRPHDEAGKAVQAAFNPLIERIDRAITAMLAMSNDWQTRKRVEEQKRRDEEKAKADALRKVADEQAKAAAASGDLDAEVKAEQAKKDADEAEKLAAREVKVSVGSATGAGRTISQREVKTIEVTNINLLFVRFREAPEVAEVLTKLATAHVRAKDWDGIDLPGTKTVKTWVAV